MNRCVVKMLNGNPVGIITKENGAQITLNGTDLIRYLGRIDERLIGRKLRKNPFIKNDGETLTYISKLHKKNIRIENSPETIEALYDLYLADRKKYREEFDPIREQEKKVKRTVAAAGLIMVGGLALAKMGATAHQKLDLETVATYDEEAIKEENTKELIMISDSADLEIYASPNEVIANNEVIGETDSQNIEADIALDESEIQSIVNTPLVHVDVDADYSPGLESNIKYLEDTINERAARWGISPNLIHDIILQESYGGTVDQVGQFEFDLWDEQPITVHNFETGKDVKIVFSNNPKDWEGKVDMIITQEDMKNVKTQVSVIGIVLQHYFEQYNHNIPITIQAYNRGPTNISQILARTAQGEGISAYDILCDQTNLSWINYAWKDENGLTYLQEVTKHIDEDQQEDGINDVYSISYIDAEGNIQTQSFQAQVNVNHTR